ncbi:PAAR domain-containing protein [Pantoea sp. KXB25]|uniref:PAAR domain-containing protein n=1 Tax=unclassified Pantoea TaxID=2630326 RepID=UPI003AB7C1CD
MASGTGNTLHGKNIALNGDKTTTGATCIASSRWTVNGKATLCVGDKTTPCPKCGVPGVISTGDSSRPLNGRITAVHLSDVTCGCPAGVNRVIAPGGHAAPRSAVPLHQADPEQHAQSARKSALPVESHEVTLTIGVFFDGTGNNAVNTQNMLKAYTAGHYNLDDPEAESILAKCARENFGVSGSGATSYTGYYTNIHWLSSLYKQDIPVDKGIVQSAVYIDGIGTDAGKPDSKLGQGFGISDTGVIAKTDNAVARLNDVLNQSIRDIRRQVADSELVIKSLQFDIFGFSRGAAAARHFANRIQSEDPAIISAIRQGVTDTAFNGSPSGKTRFIGIFDTVAAIGTPVNGLNPHSADTGDVKLTLRPGVAEKVFHITAANECRFNFALNSVKPAWPELALPGAHSDIGGGYLPVTKEHLFLTRPATETVPYSQPGEKTQTYRQAVAQLQTLDKSPCLAPLLRTNDISAETWHDDRLPPDRYGQMQKRSFAALTLRERTVRNDWSRVVLRVMLEAAQEAGVVFEPIRATNHELHLPDELSSLCDKALMMGKAVRSGQTPPAFSQDELDVIAEKYIHCSANWNAIVVNTDGFIHGGASPSELIGFINRPDEQWKRSVYSMDGKKV